MLPRNWSRSTWSLLFTDAGSNKHITAFLALCLFRGRSYWKGVGQQPRLSTTSASTNKLLIIWLLISLSCELAESLDKVYNHMHACVCCVRVCTSASLLPLASGQTVASRVACLAWNRCCDIMEKLKSPLTQVCLEHVTFVIISTSTYCGVFSGKLEEKRSNANS